jgi:flagellar hook assembly protein FlgD
VRVGDDSPVAATIYDFSGRLVRQIAERRSFSTGEYAIAWDGRNDGGKMVQPGIYFVRLEVQTDIEGAEIKDEAVLRTVAVTY